MQGVFSESDLYIYILFTDHVDVPRKVPRSKQKRLKKIITEDTGAKLFAFLREIYYQQI